MRDNDRSAPEAQSHKVKEFEARQAEREKRFKRDVMWLSLLMTATLIILGLFILAQLRRPT